METSNYLTQKSKGYMLTQGANSFATFDRFDITPAFLNVHNEGEGIKVIFSISHFPFLLFNLTEKHRLYVRLNETSNHCRLPLTHAFVRLMVLHCLAARRPLFLLVQRRKLGQICIM